MIATDSNVSAGGFPPGRTDVTKSDLPRKEWHELAEDLLARFPGVDRAALLKDVIAYYFVELKHGNKREERAACDFLNRVQRIAARNIKGVAASTALALLLLPLTALTACQYVSPCFPPI